jgi:hypothetical protein
MPQGNKIHACKNSIAKGKGKGKGKGKVFPVRFLLTEHHSMKAYSGSGGIAPLIL